MLFVIPESAVKYGFRVKPGGPHSSRTMMLAELTLLLAAAPANADFETYRSLALEDNAVHKATLSGRKEAFRRLSELYGLQPGLLLFSVLRKLWDLSVPDRPLLALMVALARDPLLRATAGVIVEACPGDPIRPGQLSVAIDNQFPSRYSLGICASTGRHAISTWAQAGLLHGRDRKVRAAVTPGPVAVAYALTFGHLCCERGLALLGTEWLRTIDVRSDEVDSLAAAASRLGMLEYRRIGSVVEISFRHLFGDEV